MKHELPPLPYGYAALEPHVDARTMTLHHDMHHKAYVTSLNAALEKLPGLQNRSAVWLLRNPDKIPEALRSAVHNNAGGHLNHSLFWNAMSPDGGGAPGGLLGAAIKHDFGGFDKFKTEFETAGAKVFGSGWVWLARTRKDGGKLTICTTAGHDNPCMHGDYPLLLNDVWEHAYYLRHENRRPGYLQGWWAVANWKEAARRFDLSGRSAGKTWEEDVQAPATTG